MSWARRPETTPDYRAGRPDRGPRRRPSRSGWVRSTLGLIAAVLAGFVVVGEAAPVYADNGLEVVTSTTYTINVAAGVVDALQVSTFTNTVPNRTSGNYIEKTYFEGSNVVIPRSATAITAVSDGVPLAVERSDIDDVVEFQILKVNFKSNVFYGGSTTVEIRYSIEGAAPRDQNDISRVNPAFAGFWAIAAGDTDKTKLTVVVPESFEVDPISDLFGSEYETINGNRAYIYEGESTASTDGNTGWQQAWVAVSDPANLNSAPVSIGDATFDIRGWTDDPEWTAFVTETLSRGVPELESMFGAPWPGSSATEVRESITPYFYGYGGWYSPEKGIEIGEDLDDVLVLHELSHGWVNHDAMEERWMIEGMAEYAGRTVAGTTEPPDEPTFAQPLLDWGQPDLGDDDDETEEAGYGTSHYVIATIFDEIGAERFDDVFAYVSSDDPTRRELEDWQAFLDVAQPIVGDDSTDSTFVSDLFAKHVTDSSGTALIDARQATRTRLTGLTNAAAPWPTPTAIDDHARKWEFTEADQQIGRATTTLNARDALTEKAADVDVEVGVEQFADPFTNATNDGDLATIDTGLATLSTTLDEVVDARSTVETSQGFFASVGALWRDDPEVHLNSATEALANGDAATASTEADRADGLASTERRTGVVRVVIFITLLLLLVAAIVVWQVVRRRRRSQDQAVVEPSVTTATPADSDAATSSPFARPPSLQTSPDVATGHDVTGGQDVESGSDVAVTVEADEADEPTAETAPQSPPSLWQVPPKALPTDDQRGSDSPSTGSPIAASANGPSGSSTGVAPRPVATFPLPIPNTSTNTDNNADAEAEAGNNANAEAGASSIPDGTEHSPDSTHSTHSIHSTPSAGDVPGDDSSVRSSTEPEVPETERTDPDLKPDADPPAAAEAELAESDHTETDPTGAPGSSGPVADAEAPPEDDDLVAQQH